MSTLPRSAPKDLLSDLVPSVVSLLTLYQPHGAETLF